MSDQKKSLSEHEPLIGGEVESSSTPQNKSDYEKHIAAAFEEENSIMNLLGRGFKTNVEKLSAISEKNSKMYVELVQIKDKINHNFGRLDDEIHDLRIAPNRLGEDVRENTNEIKELNKTMKDLTDAIYSLLNRA